MTSLVNKRQAVFEILETGSRDLLGEAPWWSVQDQSLIWVDILGRKVHRTDLNCAHIEGWSTPLEVGFCVPAAEQKFIMGLRDGLYWLNLSTGDLELEVAVERELETNRINDGKTDRRGRLWFGSMQDAEQDANSSFYRFDQRGLAPIIDNVTTSNGIGWSPDDSTMYYTDSMTRSIVAYDFDSELGEISNGRIFAEDPSEYVPDGLTVDDTGCIWAAKWDGGKVVRYTPDGNVDMELLMPISRPTSCCFVGPDLGTLAVTSAKTSRGDGLHRELEGAVFLVDVSAHGLPEEPAVVQPQKKSA